MENITVLGAREHNLQNIDVEIPRNKLTVITGLSGSGKSSLAFDTIYAEGQRRYIETFSAYARQFLGGLERPDVDKITGLSPVISIEQKTVNKNPRSTVGTTTEIYDFLRLLYARAGIAYSHETGEKMVKYTDEQIIKLIHEQFPSKKVILLAPIVKSRKGHYKELFEQTRKKGFLHVRINGEITELTPGLRVDRYKTHNIEIVIDKLVIPEKEIFENKEDVNVKRLKKSLETAMKHGKGIIMLLEKDSDNPRYYSRQLMCPTTGISYDEPAPNAFSFNSPQGNCKKCKGLGEVIEVDLDKIIPNKKISVRKGGIAPLGSHKNSYIFWQVEAIGEKYDFTLDTPVGEISDEAIDIILNGSTEKFSLKNSPLGTISSLNAAFTGILSYIHAQKNESKSKKANKWAEQFTNKIKCPTCEGQRLRKESLHFKIHDKNISQVAQMDISELAEWFAKLEEKLSAKQNKNPNFIFTECWA